MPDDRFFHKRAGHSDKVNQLSEFEELVWRYYVLSADDFGVMKFTPAQIRTDHERAERKPEKVVQKALERIRDVHLVFTFEHQGRTYCYSRNWQRHQKVTYPRETIMPCPPPAELELCDESTRGLFAAHPGGKDGLKRRQQMTERTPTVSAAVPEIFQERFPLARAGAQAQAKATAEDAGSGEGWGATDSERAGNFCEWYRETHERLLGFAYIGNPRKDYEKALELVAALGDEELRDSATFWFGQKDRFAMEGTRTVTKFASRASDIVRQLKALGVAS